MYNNRRTLITLAIGLLVTGTAYSQTADSTLLVVNNNYRFTIQVPKGWSADTVHAKDFQSDVVLYRDSLGLAKDKPIIKVTGYKKDPQIAFFATDGTGYVQKRRREMQHFDKVHQEYVYTVMIVQSAPGAKTSIFITSINPGPSYNKVFHVTWENDNSAGGEKDLLTVDASLIVLWEKKDGM